MDLDHCPTCGQRWPAGDPSCTSTMPGTEQDVVPVVCTASGPHDVHSHPPLWPGTPWLVWSARA